MSPKQLSALKKCLLGVTLLQINSAYSQETLQKLATHKQYIQEALTSSPIIATFEAEKMARKNEVDAAEWQFYPTPSYSFEQAHQKTRFALNQATSVLRLQIPVYSGGRLEGTLEKAQLQEMTAASQTLKTAEALAEEITQTMGGIQFTKIKIRALEKSEAKHALYFSQVTRRAREGYSPLSDVTLANTRWLSVKSELNNARSDLKQRHSKLGQLLSPFELPDMKNIPEIFSLESQETFLIPETQEEVTTLYKDQSTTLKIKKLEAQALHYDLKILRANYAPQVSFRIDHTRGDITKDDSIIFLSINSSLGAGMSLSASEAAARQRIDSKNFDIVTTEYELEQNARATLTELNSNTQSQVLLKAAYESASDVMASSERQFLMGRKSWQEVMNSAREAAQSEIQWAEALSTAWLSRQKLQLKTQGLAQYLTLNTPLETQP